MNKAAEILKVIESISFWEFIKKVGNQWCVLSHTTGRNFGCYPTEGEAKKRL